MARWAFLLTAFATFAAWAGAQGSAAQLSLEDRLRLRQANGLLIENLVNDGVAMVNAADSVERASRCRGAARSLVNAIDQAADAGDAERVAVLTGLYKQVVTDGLAPTIKDASQEVRPDSPRGKVLKDVRAYAENDLAALKAAIGKSDKVRANPHVQDAAKGLDELAEKLK